MIDHNNNPRAFIVEKGSREEKALILASENQRIRLHLKKVHGLISDEAYARRIAATYQPEGRDG